jgi:NAD(P)-dependent dehydrogenase (short-subunit alcohol dehydrogenase family)
MDLRSALDKAADAAVIPGYTRLGHALRRGGWDPIPEAALEGKTVVVTGATSGLGEAAATRMAGLGAAVVIVGRNPDKAEAARGRIASAARHGGGVEVDIADLSLMEEVRNLADRLMGRPEIHVLVNNAGLLLPERRVTAEGNEATLATNLLGHFLLTNLLIPRLVESAPARIVNVTSGGMYTTRISVSDLQNEDDYDGRVAYARTKRGQVILTEMWAERLRDRGVVVHSMHPGWADTPGVESGIPLFQKVMSPLLRTAEQGADTIVWLAAAAEPGETTGRFWHDREPRPTHRSSRTRETPEQRERLWRALEELSGWNEPAG